MSAADSNRPSETALTAETASRIPVQIRADDPVFQDMDVGLAPAGSVRNFTAEGLHAIRRRWRAVTGTGLVIGSVLAVGVWFGTTRQYTATAILRISAGQSNLLEVGPNHDGINTFDVYKRTQRQLLRSPSVLQAVLQHKAVSDLPLVTRQLDPLTWLQSIVAVTYPDDAEIMNVSVRCEDQKTAEALADTIVEVYLRDVVLVERQQKVSRITNLEKAQIETEGSLRSKREEMRRTADIQGSGDSETLTLAQRNTLQEYSTLWTHLNQVEMDLNRARRAQKMRERLNPAGPDPQFSVSDAEVEAAAALDPSIAAGKAHLDRLQSRIDENRKLFYGAKETEFVAETQTLIEKTRKSIEDRKKALRKELAFRKQGLAEGTDQSLATSVDVLELQRKELAKKVDDLDEKARHFGRSSIDVELKRADIKSLDELHSRIQRELHEANVEIASLNPRVVRLSSATTEHNDDRQRRLSLSAGSGGAGFLVGCALVVLFDLRRRRLNTMQEIAAAIRLPVLGAIPHVPRLELRHGSNSRWVEAIDGIVARLIFSPSDETHQVVLVTSASAGEGKTTVAVNLATSFAELGRRTVLVDFDLRRPTLHNMFDVDLVPGVGGVLAGQAEPLDAVLSTPMENLFLLPAGAWGYRGLSGRNDDIVKRIVSELRDAFVHVVIDAGPVLPIVDTRVIARHADGVVLSLLRDVSEIPKVNMACELLRSFDVRILGVVMIGAPSEVYYASTISNMAETA
jgi:polysaccharide biosynthesis transport protein